MQKLGITICASFCRVPSIKFLGPRDQIHHEPEVIKAPVTKAPVAASNVNPARPDVKQFFAPLKSGPGIVLPKVTPVRLEQWQIDIINSGGVSEAKTVKVKPISLKKK
jgi:hypothetical protein